ncbi:MAG: HAD family hydrolase, partial [Bdellovibrionia bacterium]
MLSKFPAQVNGFTPSLKKAILEGVDQAIKSTKGPWYAAFDADGTLWSFDVGETFFQFQIDHCLKDLRKDAWEHYEEMKKNSPPSDCVWLAQINKGVMLEQVLKWSQDCFSRLPRFEYFQFQKDLIDDLRKRGVEVFVVTASIRWAMLPVVKDIYGVDTEHCLGIETTVKNGIVTDEPVQPVVWGPGKADAILKRTGGVRPILASGNSMLDLQLLECASNVRLTINSFPPGT